MVSIAAFQAVDPGSIPGQRMNIFSSFLFLFLTDQFIVIIMHFKQKAAISVKTCAKKLRMKMNRVENPGPTRSL